MYDPKGIVVVGGGIAGLTSTILLTKLGIPVTLIEKKTYPFHRVCGEYISNEVISFLQKEDIFPHHLNPPRISKFRLTATNGASHTTDLPLGGFGVSRYNFDHFLAKRAVELGATIRHSTVTDIIREGNHFLIQLENGNQMEAALVIGSFGKRSNLDKVLRNHFFYQRSPYLRVKYHIKSEYPGNLITLHNFKFGYCGISQVENETFNMCYLTHKKNLKLHGSIPKMEEQILFQNPALKSLFLNAEFLFEKPLTINEISFGTKPLIENGVIMCGDSAGMITPLCGNGMAIAIHSAQILTKIIRANAGSNHFKIKTIQAQYTSSWKQMFVTRLRVGSMVQHLFGSALTSKLAVGLLKTKVGKYVISQTHGKPIQP